MSPHLTPADPIEPHPEALFVPIVDEAFTEQSKLRCVALSYSESGGWYVGSGTVLSHRGELFIVTCGHVAAGFMASGSEGQASTTGDNGRALTPSDLELVGASQSDPDLALLRIRHSRDHFASLSPITLADTDPTFDYPVARGSFAVCGFPAKQVVVRSQAARFYPLSFVAQVRCEKTTDSSLALDYPKNVVGGSLPDAQGLSGALVWVLRAPQVGKVWSPGPAVAIQHAWNQVDRFIRCDPLTSLHRWLAG